MSTCSSDLRKRPKTTSGLQFWLINGSHRFALFRDVSRPVSGLEKPVRATSSGAVQRLNPEASLSKAQTPYTSAGNSGIAFSSISSNPSRQATARLPAVLTRMRLKSQFSRVRRFR
jgi:hypothetical protein